MKTKKTTSAFTRKDTIAIILVLLIEVVTCIIEIITGSSLRHAVRTVVDVAVLLGILSVIILSAEDPFGEWCNLAVWPIVTLDVTSFIIVFAFHLNISPAIASLLCVGAVISFGLIWIFLDEVLTKKPQLTS